MRDGGGQRCCGEQICMRVFIRRYVNASSIIYRDLESTPKARGKSNEEICLGNGKRSAEVVIR